MINMSLDLYKMERGTYQYEPSSVDVVQILRSIVGEMASELASRSISVEYTVAGQAVSQPEPIQVLADETLCFSMFSNLLPLWLRVDNVVAPLAAVLGGLLCGAGMLMLFRHRASLGGFNVLVLYLQERYGWRAGLIQMALDCSIVVLAFALTDWQHIALSVLGAVAMNQTLAINHRQGRYVAM